MDLLNIFKQVTGLVNNQTRQNESVDTNGLLGQIGNIFRQHDDRPDYDDHIQQEYATQGGYNPQAGQGQILPASMDPQGDPADQGNNGGGQQANILPASMDPYGDPADQQGR